jgi:hypothetical protein
MMIVGVPSVITIVTPSFIMSSLLSSSASAAALPRSAVKSSAPTLLTPPVHATVSISGYATRHFPLSDRVRPSLTELEKKQGNVADEPLVVKCVKVIAANFHGVFSCG